VIRLWEHECKAHCETATTKILSAILESG
jgi:hypothetical protein